MRLLTRSWFDAPALTRTRVRTAYVVAGTADVLQLILGPFGWAFADQALDVIAMVIESRLLGFHPLLLPTFILEFLPLTDVLPSWTGCVALVVALRKRETTPPSDGPIIDV